MPLTAEARTEIFNKIKSSLQKQTPPMLISKDKDDVFEITGNKPVPYGSTKKIVPGMYFSSVMARKDNVSFHFFPVYMHTEEFINLIPTMSKYLTGKTCFTFKKTEQVNEKELNALIEKGVKAWKKLGYLI